MELEEARAPSLTLWVMREMRLKKGERGRAFVIFVGMKELSKHIDQIKELCSLYKVNALFAFGSVTTDKFRPDSDIDLVVDIEEKDPLSYSDSYFNFKFQLEQLLQRQIDLLEQKAIKNPHLKEQIEKTKVLIYAS
ncbi:nucleotidyltransferase family protein [Lunatimonas lonarensis]|nr:nucleotidyltransferase domain-containing protein [Lunatimonas lonarensis]